MAADACDGCLGLRVCWICHGDGCHRCGESGQCHLCVPQEGRVVHLDAPVEQEQPAPRT